MHLTKQQSARFLHLLHKLVGFIEENQNIAKKIFENESVSSSPEYLALRVMENVSEDPCLIDEFLACSSKKIDKREIETIKQWKHCYSGFFQLKEYTDDGDAILRTPFGLVSVKGITHEISDLISEVPAILGTVLMPFENVITYSTSIQEMPLEFGEGMLKLFDEWNEDDMDEPLISSAEKFIEKRDAYVEKHRAEELEALEQQMHRDAARAQGTLLPSHGFHKGALASVDSDSKREIIQDHYLKKAVSEGKRIEHLEQNAIHKQASNTLKECLERFTKSDLHFFAEMAEIDVRTSMKKAEIIEEICSKLLDPRSLSRFLSSMPAYVLYSYKSLLDADGRIDFREEEISTDAIPIFEPPVSFLFKSDKDTYTILIPQDLRKVFENIDFDEFVRIRESLEYAKSKFDFVAQLYGIVDLDVAISMLAEELDMPFSRLNSIFCILSLDDDKDFRLYEMDGKDFLLSYGLDQNELDPFETNHHIERIAIERYQEYILERQAQLGLRPLPNTDRSFYEWVMDFPVVKLLTEWLDNHVPDSADDYSYADVVIDDLFDLTRGPSKPADFIEVLSERGALSDDLDEANELISLAMRFVNDVPIWANAGWSPSELHERETGKKVFYGEDNKPMKVGRNDPCPCGSGKKYKKCCGR